MTDSAAQLSRCADGTFCPRNRPNVNSSCCDNNQGITAELSGAPIAASLINSIRSINVLSETESLSHKTTAISDSTSPTVATYAIEPTADSEQSSSANAHSTHSTAATTTELSVSTQANKAEAIATPAAAGGYSTSDKIALGVGIGIGLPTLILTFLSYWVVRTKWKKLVRHTAER